MRKGRVGVGILALLVLPGAARAQDGFWAKWSKRVNEAIDSQPKWVSPLATSSPDMSERYRSDFTRQITPSGTTTWNYGNGKGLDLIPWRGLEVDIVPPPYVQHNSPAASDGFGDFSMLAKFRIVSRSEGHGAYAVSASLGGTFPTGSFKNGSARGMIIPTIYAGKSFGDFDVLSNLGVSLPTRDTGTLGRPVTWNTAGQYRLGVKSHAWKLWPEIENNATFYHGGPNDGRRQNFVTLGMMVNGLRLSSAPASRLKTSFGAGMQIATTHFHTYNHALVISSRVNF
ncbi:MAG TPA: hypothetical protein VGR72_05090 [Candidatus Acidoferrales bacterium]|nr:hypothetical protein [Candidatus Acidoferrales bacterium]